MTINLGFSSLGIKKTETKTIPWGSQASHSSNSIYQEAQIRDVFAREFEIAHSHAGYDNKDYSSDFWKRDLDPQKGRVLRMAPKSKFEELKGGHATPVISVEFDPQSEKLCRMQVGSAEKNFSSEILFHDGRVVSVHEERVLANGTTEVLKINENLDQGTLTYSTELRKP